MAKTEKPRAKEKKPTIRQQRLSEIVRGGKEKSMGAAMRKAGYSKRSAEKPFRVITSLGWQELMDKYFPDKMLAKAERDQLKASGVAHYVFPPDMSDDDMRAVVRKLPGSVVTKITHGDKANRVYYLAPDNVARGKALDRVYKLKLKYPRDKSEDKANEELEKALEHINKLLPDAGV